MKLIKTSGLFATILTTNMIGLAFAAQPAMAQEAKQTASTPKPPSYSAVTAATAPIADAYVSAYTSRNWDVLEPLLADDASFQDPTAALVLGSELIEGRAAMMKLFRTGYTMTHMEFVKNRSLISGDTAIYEGALHWGADIGNGTIADSVTPMVILMTVTHGKVTKHLDYVDYAPFIAAVRKARAAAK